MMYKDGIRAAAPAQGLRAERAQSRCSTSQAAVAAGLAGRGRPPDDALGAGSPRICALSGTSIWRPTRPRRSTRAGFRGGEAGAQAVAAHPRRPWINLDRRLRGESRGFRRHPLYFLEESERSNTSATRRASTHSTCDSATSRRDSTRSTRSRRRAIAACGEEIAALLDTLMLHITLLRRAQDRCVPVA